jgi:microcystin-dependent protein
MKTRQNRKRSTARFVVLLLVLLTHVLLLNAQVGINVSAPEQSAVLDLSAPGKDKGLLIPRMTSQQREAIVNPVDGLLVYDETVKSFYFYKTTSSTPEPNDATKWQAVNPFSYRKGSNPVDEDHFVLTLTNSKTVVIGTVVAPTETFEVGGTAKVTGTLHATENISTPKEFVGYGTVPKGGIMMWSGVIADIPDGWALCNGQTSNSMLTPDLRGRFVVGYEDRVSPPVHSDNAYKTMNNSGGLKDVTLTAAQMPVHTHGVNDPGHTHPYNDMYRNEVDESTTSSGLSWNIMRPGMADDARTTGSRTTGISINNAGSGQAHENRPPYYVLAFIMRVK